MMKEMKVKCKGKEAYRKRGIFFFFFFFFSDSERKKKGEITINSPVVGPIFTLHTRSSSQNKIIH